MVSPAPGKHAGAALTLTIQVLFSEPVAAGSRALPVEALRIASVPADARALRGSRRRGVYL